MNKITITLLGLLAFITLFTAGLFPAVIVAALAAGACASTSVHTENQLKGGKSYKELW